MGPYLFYGFLGNRCEVMQVSDEGMQANRVSEPAAAGWMSVRKYAASLLEVLVWTSRR